MVVVQGILTVIKLEKDDDYHLVLSDPADPSGETTMIVESPDPSCAEGSAVFDRIVAVRQHIDTFFRGPIQRKRAESIPVTVTGVLFFDPLHGQEGVAPNGIELHPILDIRFPGEQ